VPSAYCLLRCFADRGDKTLGFLDNATSNVMAQPCNALHPALPRDAVKEPPLSIPWTRMRLRMVLHRKDIEIGMLESLDCAIVRVDLRDLDASSIVTSRLSRSGA